MLILPVAYRRAGGMSSRFGGLSLADFMNGMSPTPPVQVLFRQGCLLFPAAFLVAFITGQYSSRLLVVALFSVTAELAVQVINSRAIRKLVPVLSGTGRRVWWDDKEHRWLSAPIAFGI